MAVDVVCAAVAGSCDPRVSMLHKSVCGRGNSQGQKWAWLSRKETLPNIEDYEGRSFSISSFFIYFYGKKICWQIKFIAGDCQPERH